VVIFLFGCSGTTESIELRLNYPKGFQQTLVTKTTSNGKSMKMNNTIIIQMKLDSVDNIGSYVFESNVLKIQFESEMYGEVEKYDSDKEESEMSASESSFHDEFKQLLDSSLSISINKKGKVVKPFQFSNGKLSDAVDMSNIQIVFPEKAVKVGEKWTSEKSNAFAETKATYSISEITRDKIIIEMNSIIKGTLLGNSKAKGEYVLDKLTMRVMKVKIEFDTNIAGRTIFEAYEK